MPQNAAYDALHAAVKPLTAKLPIDPVPDVTVGRLPPKPGSRVAARADDRLEVVVLLEVRVDVRFPVELLDDEVEVLVLLLGHVLDQQRPRHLAALDERLVHAEHVAAPLRLVGAQ